ncbi:MAG: HAMP domain-containing sensor histidine kinase [Bacteroidota bacterium]
MDIYSRKSRWKIYLAVAGVVIVLISLAYTTWLTNKLAAEERTKAELLVEAWRTIYDDENFDPNCEACADFTFYLKVINSNKTIPAIIVTDGRITLNGVINFQNEDSLYLEKQLEKMKVNGPDPIISGPGVELYYKESVILTQLRYYPLIQLFLIGVFVFFGYVSFSAARRAEQNRVWVGMAKETAHQLGTPISAIIAWIEHLMMIEEDNPDVVEVVDELKKDVDRLNLIADRFSKIGAEPELQSINVYDALEECRIYMERRAPRKVEFDFPSLNGMPKTVHINLHLFSWVIENLLRNALDAMGNKGKIAAKVYEDNTHINIDISDTGKGIPGGKFKTVFEPGYTTKKRGWGLGLSLAKRIIQEYHSGKIFVKESGENKGTTFTIKLPKKARS